MMMLMWVLGEFLWMTGQKMWKFMIYTYWESWGINFRGNFGNSFWGGWNDKNFMDYSKSFWENFRKDLKSYQKTVNQNFYALCTNFSGKFILKIFLIFMEYLKNIRKKGQKNFNFYDFLWYYCKSCSPLAIWDIVPSQWKRESGKIFGIWLCFGAIDLLNFTIFKVSKEF